MDVGTTFPPYALLPQMDAPYRLSKGWESLCPECKSLRGQQTGVLGKEDPFLDGEPFGTRQTCSVLMVAALEHSSLSLLSGKCVR